MRVCKKRTVDSVDVACMYMCSACSELVHPAVSRVCVGGGARAPAHERECGQASLWACGQDYSSTILQFHEIPREILLPTAASGGRGLLPHHAAFQERLFIP